MSRSGYCDDFDDPLILGRWRGQVASAIRGKRGQALLRDLLASLDAMPSKRLITDELETVDGEFCALGVLGKSRGMDMTNIDPEDPDRVGKEFGIAHQLAAEIVYMNDEGYYAETPEKRWERMREWVAKHIVLEPKPDAAVAVS
jgi:hypothetical protein